MRVAVTGPEGFIAWHTRCAIHAQSGGDAVHLDRRHFDDPALMAKALVDVDTVIHLAGVNRAADDSTVGEVNPWLARQLVSGLELLDRPVPVVYGNSIHADGDTAFGVSKRRAAEVLTEYGASSGVPITDVMLPNVFGEWGRPFYNSVVSTFSHQLASGQTPRIEVDKEMPLLHVQRAAQVLLSAVHSLGGGRIDIETSAATVTEVLDRLITMSQAYRTGDLPDLSDSFTRDLFNTYRSFTFPDQWPIHPEWRTDERGGLAEAVRSSGGESQVFFSTTNPGRTRGQHFHLHKVERFVVLSGQGVIRLRKLFSDDVVEFPVSGEQPAIVDMPTMWVHSITNVGGTDLLTLFFADELFDAERPDTFAEEV